MDNNASLYTAHVVQEYLQREGITRIDWPAYSLYLNPIEHIWNGVQVLISACQVQPRTLQELGAFLVDEWNAIPQRVIQNLIGGGDAETVSICR